MLIGNYFKQLKTEYKNFSFSGLSFNSSKCKKGNIFFAIKGQKHDGNKYIREAIDRGCKIIVQQKRNQGIKDGVLYIKSKNVRKDLSLVSHKYFNSKLKKIVAVTGTNGKSSIADFYYQILLTSKKKVASIGTLGIKTEKKIFKVNNTTLDPITLAKSLKLLDSFKIDNIIMEASSHGLHQNRLDGIKFNGGIFTNLSHDHLDYHKSVKNYLNSKLYLFKKLLKKNSFLITNSNIPQYNKIKKIAEQKKLKLFPLFDKKGIKILEHKYIGEKQFLSFIYQKKKYSFETNLIGKIQISNLLMAGIAAQNSKIKFSTIIKNFNKIKPVNGRFEKIGKLKNNALVILDYAHTPDALKICLQNIKEQFEGRNIKILFGCGGDRDKAKRSKMGTIAAKFCSKIYITNDNPRNESEKKIRDNIKTGVLDKKKLHEIPDRENAIKHAIKDLKTSEILIVAGKGHENIQIVKNRINVFSDKSVIKKNILMKNKFLSNNLKKNIFLEECNNDNLRFNNGSFKGVINSKEIKKNDIFFAIKGKNKDGNKFIGEAFNKGASLAVVNKIDKSKKSNRQIKVENTLAFLTKTSEIIRQNSLSKIIAITGSCGKTSLKELLTKTLSRFGNVSSSPKSFNNKYGVPLSLFNLNVNHDYGVFEAGMDKKGEIDRLTKIIKPDVGIITNISYAHAKNFKNINQIALAKAEIINNIKPGGLIILNADDSFFSLHKKIAFKKNLQVLTFGMYKKANVQFRSISRNKNNFKISVVINNKKTFFNLSSNFENFIKNLLAVITVISYFADPFKLDKNIFRNFQTPEGRGDILKIKINKKNINLVDESYNSNPLSLKSAIQNFNMIKTRNKKYMILGDMMELGRHSKIQHRKIAPIINSSGIDKINILGNHIKETFKNIKPVKKGLILSESLQIIDLIKNQLNNNDYLMIKGSNSTGLNKFTKELKKNVI